MISIWTEALHDKLQSGGLNTVLFVIAIATISLVLQLYDSNAKSRYPLVGADLNLPFFRAIRQRQHWFNQGPELIHSSFKKFPNSIFTLPSLDRTSIVLPPKFLGEIKELPGTIGSNSHATSDVSSPTSAVPVEFSDGLTQKFKFFIGNWTTLDYDIFAHATIDAIKAQYIARIGQQIGPASNEASYAFNKHFGRYQGMKIASPPRPFVSVLKNEWRLE